MNKGESVSLKPLPWLSRLPGFVYGPFRNVGCYRFTIGTTLKTVRISLILEHQEILNFNHVCFWATDEKGQLYQIKDGFSCTMSSVADVLPDPNLCMFGDGSNSVSVHSKREVKPWWQVTFDVSHNIAFVEFYNRKDKWGIRSKSMLLTGFDDKEKKVYQGGRITKKTFSNMFIEQGLPALEQCVGYLKKHNAEIEAEQIEKQFCNWITAPKTSEELKCQLLNSLHDAQDKISLPTPDIGGTQSDALKLQLPKGTVKFRLVGYRRKLTRQVSLSIHYKSDTHVLEESLEHSFGEEHHRLRQTIWTLQYPHVFEFTVPSLLEGGELTCWYTNFYSGDAFVQRVVQYSEDGHNWTTLESTLDNLAARLTLITVQEWLLGTEWSEKFVSQLGSFLATFRMSQTRTVKPLVGGQKGFLPKFIESVEQGGKTAKYLPSVEYSRHGLTIPFKNLDSNFLAQRMHSFTAFLKDKFNLDAFPCYGTLLGIYRDGDFLGHDDDIDLAVVVDLPDGLSYRQATERWAQTLKDVGLNCKPPTPTSLNIHCYFEDFDMDLFFIYRMPDVKRRVWTHMQGYQPRKVKQNLLEPLVELHFQGFRFNAPHNIEGFLLDRYGKGWITPDPTYEL